MPFLHGAADSTFIGDLLVAHKLVTSADVGAALDHQRTQGGRLGEILIAHGRLSCADLEAVLRTAPGAPGSVSETGLRLPDLLNLTIKAVYTSGAETTSAIVDIIKLPNRVVQLVLEQAKERKLLGALGAASIRVTSELRYALTEKGKQWALDAIGQNQYVGPTPVSLDAYRERIDHQRITGEQVDRAAVERAFEGLEISKSFVEQIGPALNSG